MTKLILPMAEIVPETSARMVNGNPTFFAKVLWLGGQTTCANPNKFSGLGSNVEVEVTVNTAAKVGGGFAPKNADGTRGQASSTFGAIVHELRYTAIVGGKFAK